MQTLTELFRSMVRKQPDKTFIKYKNQDITYREMDRKTSKLANVLKSYGVTKGSAVGLYLPSCLELALGYYACQKIGAVAVPMSSMCKHKEVENAVESTDMTFIVTTKENYEIADGIRNSHSTLKHIMVIRDIVQGSISFEEAIKTASTDLEEIRPDLNDTAVVFFTSGTTGKPKGAMQTHKSIYSAVQAMNVYWKFQYGKEKILCSLPIFNNFGATVNMNGALLAGSTLILHERWDTKEVLKTIATERITFFSGAPTMFQYLLEENNPSVYDISSLRLCISGGASIAPEVVRQIEERFLVKLVQVYGATETSGAITAEPVDGEKKAGSVGVPLGSTVIKIVGDNGAELPPREIGEIVIQSDAVGNGYWNDKEATAHSFKTDGWYSGDLGYLDEEGFLYIIDRKKEVIITSGSNVFPVEVEEVLYTLKEVSLAAVVGIPHDVKGEIPKAYIKLKNGETLSEEEIIDHCRQHLSAYKVPKKVEFVKSFPLGPTGKILKKELRKQYVTE